MITMYIIRALEVDYVDGEWRYHRMETKERFGPFINLTAMLDHIQGKMLQEITAELHRKRH
jgi:hypothetical protein